MEAVGARHRRFSLQVDMRCVCKGCPTEFDKAMASIRTFTGVETLEGDFNTGIVTVTGTVNPEKVCELLKRKTKKHVSIVCSDPSVDKNMLFNRGRGSSSGTGRSTAPSAAPSSCPSGARPDSDHEDMRLIEDQIRDLERARDRLKIRSLEKELHAAKSELRRSKGVDQAIRDGKKALLDAYDDLDSLDH